MSVQVTRRSQSLRFVTETLNNGHIPEPRGGNNVRPGEPALSKDLTTHTMGLASHIESRTGAAACMSQRNGTFCCVLGLSFTLDVQHWQQENGVVDNVGHNFRCMPPCLFDRQLPRVSEESLICSLMLGRVNPGMYSPSNGLYGAAATQYYHPSMGSQLMATPVRNEIILLSPSPARSLPGYIAGLPAKCDAPRCPP